ncbi:hypothetical protein [Streptococcus hyointestinalis]|uniref:hypothetical protein n=1 Tax=Streptococcus hyointestinalis TaxID=1337 RepID=UPI0013DFE07C|nr:hypothetical protein [Streptococcus hyointestinalis]
MSNTRKCLKELLKYNLSVEGFTVTNQGNYLKAVREKEKYRILPVTRTIPVNSETTTVEANKETVKKFQKRSDPRYIDCIAYVIGKVNNESVEGFELFIISIEEFEKYVQPDKKTGDVLSRASEHYHYNYAKYTTKINELTHVSWVKATK